ncbi:MULTISPECIES: response regulator [Epilithonimonas]|uniref:response regulator n=1 Tax=Epilithonimonas TaxID=2782229 RepID=UPI00289DF80F|nr:MULTISPECIES: response regulator [Epilithonimonas]
MSKTTILIFDIDSSFRELLEVIFEESPYKIASSDSSQNTIQQIEFHRPFVVLINTWMSGDNAFKITHHIRQDLYFNNIPIILMGTNFNLAALKNAVGADDFIVQPFDIDDIERKIDIYSHHLIT